MALIPHSHYGKYEYWEKRYEENQKPFDWYQDFEGIKDITTQYITFESKILNIGCGTSPVSEEMYEYGYENIINIDYSKTLIPVMQERYNDYPENFKYLWADVRSLPFEDGQFDCVIDKGTLDCVLCSEYSSQNQKKMLDNVHRVLQPKGVYIIVSYGQPKYRLGFLEKPCYDWTVTNYKVYKPNVNQSSLEFDVNNPENYHYIYVCKRGTSMMIPGNMKSL